MRNGSILLSIKPVIPNPVTELNDWKARIPFVVAGPSLIRCQIMDELGRVVHVQSLKTETGGAFDFIVDAKDLPSGAYSYLIELPEDSHASAVGRFVVSK
jgi:hypothetical protein